MPNQDTALIPLRARDGSVRAYAIVDAADAEWANQWRWHLSGKYACRSVSLGGRRAIQMHRELIGLMYRDGIQGDHINLDKLDNRRKNLRPVPNGKNSQNRPSNPGSLSQYRGVSWDRSRSKWIASVMVNGKTVHAGRFTSEHEAGRAAREARARLLPYSVD